MQKGVDFKMAIDNRTPNWSCIVYPDSLPQDWEDQLDESTIEVCVSPLHDCDVWTEKDEKKNPEHKAGTPKKPHYHVVIMYGKGNKKSLDQVKEDFGFLNGTQFKKVKSLIGMIQYLDHRYCQNKHHYDEREVKSFGGFDYDDLVNTPTDKQAVLMLKDMRQYIIENDIIDLCDFQDAVDCDEELTAWNKVLNDNYYKMNCYITSRRNKARDKAKAESQKSPRQLLKEAMENGFKEDE